MCEDNLIGVLLCISRLAAAVPARTLSSAPAPVTQRSSDPRSVIGWTPTATQIFPELNIFWQVSKIFSTFSGHYALSNNKHGPYTLDPMISTVTVRKYPSWRISTVLIFGCSNRTGARADSRAGTPCPGRPSSWPGPPGREGPMRRAKTMFPMNKLLFVYWSLVNIIIGHSQ